MKKSRTQYTSFPPLQKPVMVWDGNCGFCRYWKLRWEAMGNGKISYLKLQHADKEFPDISMEVFKKSVCLVDLKGNVFQGAGAVFRSFHLMGKYEYLYSWYNSSRTFRLLSEKIYVFIAGHRETLMKLSHLMFGKNPLELKYYWLIYLLLLLAFLFLAVHFL